MEAGLKLAVLLPRVGRDAVATLGVKLDEALPPLGGTGELEGEVEASSGSPLVVGVLGLNSGVLSGGWSTRRLSLM